MGLKETLAWVMEPFMAKPEPTKTILKDMSDNEIREYFKSEPSEEQLDQLIADNEIKEWDHEVDYTRQMWGHAFNVTDSYHYVHYGYGFYSHVYTAPGIKAGSILLLKTANGIGRYLVLYIKKCNDPKDMFWAYVVNIGYK